ncbi:MAG: type II toxin-antitoxin system VapC family toxin [Caulobacteraceae bacterium]|nr:type II toxin-antitoxin system VapC family toxin [Caulobacteraceae bacterium]
MDDTLLDLAALPIRLDPHTDRGAWSDILRLAREEGLTVYDAAYLELAIRIRLALASGDRALVKAAERRAVETIAV